MATTNDIGPAPDLGDDPNIPRDILAVLNAIRPLVRPRYTTTTARDAANPTPVAGQEVVLNGVAQFWSGSAWVSIPGQPVAAQVAVSAGSSYGNNTITQVGFGSTLFAVGGMTTNSGGIVVPVAGKYRVFAAIGWAAGTGQALLYPSVNGANVGDGQDRVALGASLNAYNRISGFVIVCAAGDVIGLRAQQVSGGTLASAAGATWLSAELVSL